MDSYILANRLKNLREKHGYLQKFVADKLGIRSNTLSGYENGTRSPDPEMIVEIANLYNVTTDYLLGKSNSPEFTEKDEKDIAKDLKSIINNLENPNDGYAAYEGEILDDIDEEDRELLIASIEQSMRIAKQIAKKKFTPKKYRKEE